MNDILFLVGLLASVLVIVWILRVAQPTPAYTPPVRVPPKPTCASCVHWDQDAGRQVMARFPIFAQAAAVITPAEMAYGYEYNENDERVKLNGPPEAATIGWGDFGACDSHSELRHKSDKCDRYEAKS